MRTSSFQPVCRFWLDLQQEVALLEASQGVLGADQDGELGRGVAVEVAGDEEVAVAQGPGPQVAHVVERSSTSEGEVLIADDARCGVDLAQVDPVALAAGEVQDLVDPDRAVRGMAIVGIDEAVAPAPPWSSSSPRLPLRTSLPEPPRSTSARLPPISRSSPAWPAMRSPAEEPITTSSPLPASNGLPTFCVVER